MRRNLWPCCTSMHLRREPSNISKFVIIVVHILFPQHKAYTFLLTIYNHSSVSAVTPAVFFPSIHKASPLSSWYFRRSSGTSGIDSKEGPCTAFLLQLNKAAYQIAEVLRLIELLVSYCLNWLRRKLHRWFSKNRLDFSYFGVSALGWSTEHNNQHRLV